jgi:hypothetical protein
MPHPGPALSPTYTATKWYDQNLTSINVRGCALVAGNVAAVATGDGSSILAEEETPSKQWVVN